MSLLPQLLAFTAVFALGASLAAAQSSARVEVFTTNALPISNAGDAQVHLVDALHNIAESLGQDLPKQPDQARQVALERMQSVGPQFSTKIQRAAMALTKAAQYRIDRVPAVVFDARLVVYGVRDMAQAQALYRQWCQHDAACKR